MCDMLLIDINSASADELTSLNGVGEATAKKIIAGRPYTSVDDLAKAGVSKSTITKIRSQVTVGAQPMVNCACFRARRLWRSRYHGAFAGSSLQVYRRGQDRTVSAGQGDGLGQHRHEGLPLRGRSLVRQDQAREIYDGSRRDRGRLSLIQRGSQERVAVM